MGGEGASVGIIRKHGKSSVVGTPKNVWLGKEYGGRVVSVTTVRLGRRRKWVEFEARIDVRSKDRVTREFVVSEHEDHVVEVGEVLAISMSLVASMSAAMDLFVNGGHASASRD